MDNAGITFNRFRNDQAFQQGFEAGGRILGQGSLVLGRYGRTISEAPYDPESEIETLFMRCLGFQKLVEEPYHIVRYFSDTVIVEDLHPGNIWMTGDSNVVIIDAYYRFNSPGLGLGGKFIFG